MTPMKHSLPILALAVLIPLLPLEAQDSAPVEPLSLASAHQIALRNHPQVAIGQLRELVAQEVLRQNQAPFLPTADAYIDGVEAGNRDARVLAGSLNNPSVYDRVADGVEVSEMITDFGRTRNFVASAKLDVRAAGEDAAAINERILLQVDVNYFSTLQAAAVLKVARDTVHARQLLESQVEALARNQLKSELDVGFAQVALEESRLLLQKAENDAVETQAGLSAALGYRGTRQFYLTDLSPPVSTPPGIDSLLETALADRPDLLRLRSGQESAQRLARAERDRNFPTIAAVGAVGNAISHDTRLPNQYAVGGIEMDIPLFAGGAFLAQQREAELKEQIAEEAVRDLEDDVARDVRVAWLNFNTSVERLNTTEELLKHANQSYSLAKARYNIGSSSIVELTDAQLSATSAQIAEANARYDELIQQSILDYQVGNLR
jgi:outer membrane protein